MNTRAFCILAVACLCLAGCMAKPAVKQEPPLQASARPALPSTPLFLTAKLIDENTGQPIPDVWVLVTAHLATDRPATNYNYKAAAANRIRTGQDGIVSISEVQGIYYPQAPKDKLYMTIEEARADRLGKRKVTGIVGGSILVAAAKYGLIHQPFAIEDNPAFQEWLRSSGKPAEDYGGWVGRENVKDSRKAVMVKAEDAAKGIEITIRLKKAGTADLSESFNPLKLWSTGLTATSRHTGTTEEEKLAIYSFFYEQMRAIAEETKDPRDQEHVEAYPLPEAVKAFMFQASKPDSQDGTIQAWLVEKALEILPPGDEEAKRHVWDIMKGVEDEGDHPRWRNHYYDPAVPEEALPDQTPLLRWGALDGHDNPGNEWDWEDAQSYYRQGDKAKAYEALGHVLRLLTNLSIPKYMQMNQEKESEFEKSITGLFTANASNLPPEYYLSAREPLAGKALRERFDSVAKRTMEESNGNTQTPLADEAMRNGYGGVPWETTAKKTFPSAIEQAAGVMRDFHGVMNPAKVAAVPGDGGDGGSGPGQVLSQSTGAVAALQARRLSVERRPLREIVSDYRATKNSDKRKELEYLLRKRIPETEEEKQLALGLLDDQEPESKVIAMSLLARAKEKRAVPKIIGLLKHPKYSVLVTAAMSLGEIGDERAVEPLLENPDLMILEFGRCPISRIGAPALPKLAEAARHSNLTGFLPKKDKKDRRSRGAASCIGQVRDEKAIPELMKLLRDDDETVRLAAIQSLAGMKAKQAEPEFERMLQDPDEDVRRVVLRALALTDKAKYRPKVIEAINSKDGFEKTQAIDLLGEVGDKDSVKKLEEQLADGDEFVRHKAAHALWKMTGKVYEYKKGKSIQQSERFWRNRLKDARKTGHENPKNAVREAQKNGFLLDEKAE